MTSQEKVSGIVYKATSPSGKVYIGITITPLKERKRTHLRSVKNGSELPLHNAIRKYGMKNIRWDTIDKADTWDELCEIEAKYIEEFDSYSNGYNLTLGGEGTFGLKHDEEWCIRNSERRKKFFQNPINREMQSLANQRAHDENPVQAIEHSKFMKERYKKKSAREKTAEGMRKFLANSKSRRIHSIQRGAKPFFVYRDGELIGEWLTQRECARDLNLDFSHINRCLHGKRKSHGGYTFKYKDNE
jgi:group I intron endonuclease